MTNNIKIYDCDICSSIAEMLGTSEENVRSGCIIHKHIGFIKLYGKLDDPRIAFPYEKGWHYIVDKLITDLFKIGWDGDVHQVKNKFGSLRFYTGEATEEMFELIDKTEQLSSITCVSCGRLSTKIKTRQFSPPTCENCSNVFKK